MVPTPAHQHSLPLLPMISAVAEWIGDVGGQPTGHSSIQQSHPPTNTKARVAQPAPQPLTNQRRVNPSRPESGTRTPHANQITANHIAWTRDTQSPCHAPGGLIHGRQHNTGSARSPPLTRMPITRQPYRVDVRHLVTNRYAPGGQIHGRQHITDGARWAFHEPTWTFMQFVLLSLA